MQNTNIPLLQRPGKSRTVLIAGAIALSHIAVGTVAFYAGVEHMRSAVLQNLDAMEQQLEQNFNEAFGLEPESDYEPQSYVSESENYLDESTTAQLGTDETPEGEPAVCWGGKPCESAIVPGVYYVQTSREGGPKRWPELDIRDPAVAEQNGVNCLTLDASATPCYDEATGFDYGYNRGWWQFYSQEAVDLGMEGYGTQQEGDSAGLARPQS